MGLFKKSAAKRLDEVAGVLFCIASANGDISEEQVLIASAALARLSGDALDDEGASERLLGAAQEVARVGADAFLASAVKKLDAAGREEVLAAAATVAACGGQASDATRAAVRRLATLLSGDAQAADALIDGALAERQAFLVRSEQADRVRERLAKEGWSDPFESLRAAGASVSGFGAAFQREVPGHLLRLEHHAELGTLEFHVTDEDDSGFDYALEYGDRLEATLDALLAIQDGLNLINVNERMRAVARVCPKVVFMSGGAPLPISPG